MCACNSTKTTANTNKNVHGMIEEAAQTKELDKPGNRRHWTGNTAYQNCDAKKQSPM